jgi:hypothetical protein
MVPVKDPSSDLDYSIDWSLYLQDGETITASTFTVDPSAEAPNPLEVLATNFQTPYTTASLTGGTARHRYALINRITTDVEIDTGRYRVVERSITMAVEDR